MRMRTLAIAAIPLIFAIFANVISTAAPTPQPSDQSVPPAYAWLMVQPIESERLPSPTDFDRTDKQDGFKNWDLFTKLSTVKQMSEIKDWSIVYDPKSRLVGFVNGCCGSYTGAIERVATAPPPGIAHANLSHVVTTFGLHIGSTRADLESAFGAPLHWIEYGNRLYRAADYRRFDQCLYDSIYIVRDDVVEGILFSAGC